MPPVLGPGRGLQPGWGSHTAPAETPGRKPLRDTCVCHGGQAVANSAERSPHRLIRHPEV